MRVLADHGRMRLERLDSACVFALAMLAGGFITMGALLSVLLAAGASSEGAIRLLEGYGFSAGFFFVILSGAVLFTEANVALPEHCSAIAEQCSGCCGSGGWHGSATS